MYAQTGFLTRTSSTTIANVNSGTKTKIDSYTINKPGVYYIRLMTRINQSAVGKYYGICLTIGNSDGYTSLQYNVGAYPASCVHAGTGIEMTLSCTLVAHLNSSLFTSSTPTQPINIWAQHNHGSAVSFVTDWTDIRYLRPPI